MSEQKPKFSYAEAVWCAEVVPKETFLQCPDCFGKKFLRVILGDDSEVTVDCSLCERGYLGPQGLIISHDYAADIEMRVITSIEVRDGEFHYGFYQRSGAERNCFTSPDDAKIRASELQKEYEDREQARLAGRENPNRSWAWNVNYHRGSIRRAKKDIEYHTKKLAMALEYKKVQA